MSKYTIKQIADGIIRIRDAEGLQTLAERYDILKVPTDEKITAHLEVGENYVVLPNGKKLNFDIRPETDDEFWSNSAEFLLDKFKERHLNHVVAEGNPNNYHEITEDSASELVSDDVHFGISFKVSDTAKFYGLGEASRDRLELRGRAYQNWTYYQYNEIPTPFFMSNDGWGLLINAAGRHFVDLCENHADRATVLGECDRLDVFLLCGTMPEMLKLYSKLTGRSMLFPGWAYGLTYIAPIFSNQFEVLDHAERFIKEEIPCDMFSLEPGWQQTFYDFSTDVKWNLDKFHMPEWLRDDGERCKETFIGALKRMGYHLSLWYCVRYDLTDEAERVYRGDDHNAYEPWYKHLGDQTQFGVEGFKLDPADLVWKCEPSTICANGVPQLKMHNLNQVLLPKQVYEGYKKQKGKRPMLHYCGGYMGSQKWGGATTGDNGGEHGSMIWLLTLAMSGFSNTTVDMHIFDANSLHFGFLVPWAHLNAWEGVRQPWFAGKKYYELFKYYARLRYSLYPYIYSAALEAHEEAMPMVRPLPLMFPDFAEGIDNTCQYMFGDALMVCAYTDTVSLPEGKWFEYYSGEEIMGPVTFKPTVPENRGGPLFVHGGAIIPMTAERIQNTGEYDPSKLILDIYPYKDSEYTLREDDRISLDYETNTSAHTVIKCHEADGNVRIDIGAPSGTYAGMSEARTFIVRVHGSFNNIDVNCERKNDSYVLEH